MQDCLYQPSVMRTPWMAMACPSTIVVPHMKNSLFFSFRDLINSKLPQCLYCYPHEVAYLLSPNNKVWVWIMTLSRIHSNYPEAVSQQMSRLLKTKYISQEEKSMVFLIYIKPWLWDWVLSKWASDWVILLPPNWRLIKIHSSLKSQRVLSCYTAPPFTHCHL